MRKTHQSALALKQALVQQLQDIIVEKDETIDHLKSQLKSANTDDHKIEPKPCVNKSQVHVVYTSPPLSYCMSEIVVHVNQECTYI